MDFADADFPDHHHDDDFENVVPFDDDVVVPGPAADIDEAGDEDPFVAAETNWVLFCVVPLLVLLQMSAPVVVNALVSRLASVSEGEARRRAEVSRLRAEQKGVSMMDEFARFARIDRKVIKITEEIKQLASVRAEEQKSARRAFGLTLYGLLGLAYLLLLAVYGRRPVFWLDPAWLFPLGWAVALPLSSFSVPGAVGLPFWAACCRQAAVAANDLLFT